MRCNPWAAYDSPMEPQDRLAGDTLAISVNGEAHVVDASLDPSAESQRSVGPVRFGRQGDEGSPQERGLIHGTCECC
jgi:hypothetical protein